MKRTASLVIVLFIGLFTLIYSGQETAVAQSDGMPPTQDTYTSRNNPGANLNGRTLLVSYDQFGPFQPSDFSFIQFDLTAETSPIPNSTLKLTIVNNLGAADDLTVGIYAVTEDGWDAATLTHDSAPAAGALLQTLTINRGFNGDIHFGDSDNAHPVGTYFENERMGDGIASLMLRIESASNPDFFQGSLIMDDVEGTFDGQNGNEPALMSDASPTAITLSQISGTAVQPPSLYLLIPFLLLGLMTLFALKRNR